MPIQLVECPRDAMQGWPHPISTTQKINYLNVLLQAGFHTLDCGSFVSPKAIPQMADTAQVLQGLQLNNSATKLLVIVANIRGAEEAVQYDEVTYIGFPFSISPTFQMRNTNSTMEQSVHTIQALQALCSKHHKQMVVYLSMGFGNPYGDAYSAAILVHWATQMANMGVGIISLADTVGLATPQQITQSLQALIPAFPSIVFGVHLHSTATGFQQKLQAAIDGGCQRFDGAIKGIGGCPMAQDALVGNMPTEAMIQHFHSQQIATGIQMPVLEQAINMATNIFI